MPSSTQTKSAEKFRLLQLAHVNIANPTTGSQLRNYYIARALAKVMDVTHLAFGEAGETVRSTKRQEQVRMILTPTQRAYTAAKLVRGALGPTPVTLLNFYTKGMAAVLANELAGSKYETVLIEGIEMVAYLPVIMAAKRRASLVVLDWHNLESEIVARHSYNARTPLHRLYMRRVLRQLKRIESEVLKSCDLHLVTSERERDVLLKEQAGANVVVAENGVNYECLKGLQGPNDRSDWARRHRVLFVGSMDYSANIDAVQNFARQVWPQLHRRFPETIFTIVGRNPPEKIRAMTSQPGVEVTGTVADVRPYYRQAFAAVVPLRLGGGTRVKVLEAMGAGVPVVSTAIGAEGLRVRPGIHLCQADTANDFARAVALLRIDQQLSCSIAAAGRRLVASTYDWKGIGAHLADKYLDLLNRRALQNEGLSSDSLQS